MNTTNITNINIPGIEQFTCHHISSASSSLLLHHHKNCFDFTIISEGVFKLSGKHCNYIVSGGDIFITYPDEDCIITEMPLSHGTIYTLQLIVDSADRFLFLADATAATLIEQLNRMDQHIVKSSSHKLVKLLQGSFIDGLCRDNPNLLASYLVLFFNLLIMCSKDLPASLTTEISNSLYYIFDNIEEDISLDVLASNSNLSVSQFKSRFKKEMGITPRNYINMQKIETAKTLLLQSTSKTDVALRLGFTSSSYFSAVFKKYTSQTPSEYILAHRDCNEGQ